MELSGTQSDYLEHCGALRLPNIAHVRLDDDQRVAEMMNFVVFELGVPTPPKEARPFTAAEVAAGRPKTMTGFEVMDMRKAVVDELIRSCHAPRSLREAYPGEMAVAVAERRLDGFVTSTWDAKKGPDYGRRLKKRGGAKAKGG